MAGDQGTLELRVGVLRDLLVVPKKEVAHHLECLPVERSHEQTVLVVVGVYVVKVKLCLRHLEPSVWGVRPERREMQPRGGRSGSGVAHGRVRHVLFSHGCV